MNRAIDILYKEGATKAQEDEAQWILEALDFAYPGHPWGVRVYDGGFFIRHLDFDGNWGMNCKKKFSSASELKREVIQKAGEFLERAGLKRGAWDWESTIPRLEGVPEKFQPTPHPQDVKEARVRFDTVIAAAEREMRDGVSEIRPQVLEALKNG